MDKFSVKETELKKLTEISLNILIVNFYWDKWKCLSMFSSLSLLFNRNMIFRLKNNSSRQLFLIPQPHP